MVGDISKDERSSTHNAVLANSDGVNNIRAEHYRGKWLDGDAAPRGGGWGEAGKYPHYAIVAKRCIRVQDAELADLGCRRDDRTGENYCPWTQPDGARDLRRGVNHSDKPEARRRGANSARQLATQPVVADGDDAAANIELANERGQMELVTENAVTETTVAYRLEGVDDTSDSKFILPFHGVNDSAGVAGTADYYDVRHVLRGIS
jgi:hypothetical protein